MANAFHDTSKLVRGFMHLLPWLVLALSLLGTLLMWDATKAAVSQNQRSYFDYRVREITNRIENRLQAYEQVLLGVRGLYEISEYLDRNEFRAYVASLHLADNYPGIQGVGFSLIVPAAEMNKHLVGIRKQGFPEYSIRPEGQRNPYTSIIYLEPFSDRNLRAFGYDMYSEPVRRQAMERARDTGSTAMSGKVRLVQESGKNEQAGFLMYVPVYKYGLPHNTPAERRENIIGWVYSPFRMNDLINNINKEPLKDIDLEIFDGKEPIEKHLMYDSDKNFTSKSPPYDSLQSDRIIKTAGHAWTINFRALPGIGIYFAKSRPTMVAIAGSLFSLLATLLVWLLVTGRERALSTAQKMNRELIEAEANLSSTLNAIPDLLFEIGLDGRYYNIHAPNSELLVAPKNILIGKLISEILPPEASTVCLEALQEANEKGSSFGRQFKLELNQERKWFELSIALKESHYEDGPRFIVLSRDVTTRKNAEDDLRISEERLALATRTGNIGIWDWDVVNNVLLWDDAMYKLYGIREEDFCGTYEAWANVLHPEDKALAESEIQAALRGEREYAPEFRAIWPDGTVRYIKVASHTLLDDKGKPLRMVGVNYDLTERKNMEIQLQEALEKLNLQTLRLQTLLDTASDGIHILDTSGNITQFSDSFARMLGYSREETARLNVADWDSQISKNQLVPTIRNLINKPATFETRHRRKDGSVFEVEINAKGIELEGKQYLYASSRDITERKQYEEALRINAARLRATLDNSPYLIWQKDIEGRFIAINMPFLKTTGLKKFSDVLGKTDYDLWPRELAEKYHANDAEVLATSQQKVFEEQAFMENGQQVLVETFKTPILDEEGNMLGTAGFSQDISERKRYIEGLRKAQQLAEETAVAKSNFLANMSHEIRTPMNAIIGLSQLALNKTVSVEVRDYLKKIFNSSNNLLRILNDILDISKIEAGGITIESTNFNLDIVLKNLDTLFRAHAEEKYLEFSVRALPDVPRNLVGDAFRLQQVLSNLLGNAIKFTEHGKVALRVALKDIDKERATLRFSVEDSGIGIAQEDISKLFQPFSQLDGSITRRFGGTGLGLAISHDLLQLMGSDFNVESNLGKGTTFTFELTLDVASAHPSQTVSQHRGQDEAGALSKKLHEHGYPLAGAYVLVVEDDIVNQQVVREFLELSGVMVTLASNGKEALEALDNGVFDAVLMDVHMPVMDGIEATRQIRAQPRFAGVPVIALTADIASENREHYLACGMNELLSKPIQPEQLIAVLARLLGHKKSNGD